METVVFGRTGVEVSRIAVGTWGHGGERTVGDRSVGWSGHDDEDARDALRTAAENGITHWDTADVYGDGQAEAIIGSMWEEVDRDEIFLASKVGWDPGEWDHYYHPQLIRDRLERSLDLMKVDHIDLYYLHHCDFGEDDRYLPDAIEVMRSARDEGKIRFIGLSDWDSSKIVARIEQVDPDVVQPYRNVVDDDYESSGLREIVDARNLGVAFFSPLKHGLLLGKYDRVTRFPEGDFRSNIEDFRGEEAIERYRAAAAEMRDRFAESPEPVLLAVTGALLADAPTGSVLLGQRNRDQAVAAARVGRALGLDEADVVRRAYQPND